MIIDENFTEIKEYCDTKEIGFLSTGFDAPSLEFLIVWIPLIIKFLQGKSLIYLI